MRRPLPARPNLSGSRTGDALGRRCGIPAAGGCATDGPSGGKHAVGMPACHGPLPTNTHTHTHARAHVLCRQAYGAGRYHLVGLVLQRALLLLTLVAALVAVVWTQAEPILLLLGQDPEIAHGTAQFLLRWGPGAGARLRGLGLPAHTMPGLPACRVRCRSLRSPGNSWKRPAAGWQRTVSDSAVLACRLPYPAQGHPRPLVHRRV